ncbi:hypothetical protein N7452_002831 [Penicillium brevicompactum]|uniref:Rhodopsin domain-containing protein n=1 Tax=Penicillium brevicompactum TaxID=5074 RepID=A0A9W9UJE9_PENBR|nr:hypothetical protein N7452_002831 [Penicillium brevicompactum]
MSSEEALAKILAAPALPPPAGVTPNFDNPPNSNTLAWFVTTFCMVVATLCLLLRAYVKIWLDKKLRVEEVMMIGAYGAYWGTAYAAYSLIYTPGYGVHTWNLHNQDLIKPLYLILVYGCSYSAVLPLIKTAILLDWGRIFVAIDRSKNLFWWGCMFVSFIQCAWGISCIILLNMQCRPHAAIWKFYLPSKCYSLPKVMLASASIQVISDILMFLLPQKIIWSLQMNWQKKLGISVIFGVGILASLAACFRLAHTVTFATEADSMFLIGPLLFWACAEMTCGFFIFSMPCLSKMVMESGLPRKVKSALGISAPRSSSPSYENSNSAPQNKPWRKKNKVETTWSTLADDDIPLSSPGASESQERLNNDRFHERAESIHVLHTTKVTVSREEPTGDGLSSPITPWIKKS